MDTVRYIMVRSRSGMAMNMIECVYDNNNGSKLSIYDTVPVSFLPSMMSPFLDFQTRRFLASKNTTQAALTLFYTSLNVSFIGICMHRHYEPV